MNIIVKVLRQSLDRAVSKGWLPENPERKVDLLREDKPEIDPFSLAEAKTFISEGVQEMAYGRYRKFIPHLRGRDGRTQPGGWPAKGSELLRGYSMVTRDTEGVTVLP